MSIFLWDESNNQWQSETWIVGLQEPVSGLYTASGLTAGIRYYVGVEFVDAPPPESYDLYIYAH